MISSLVDIPYDLILFLYSLFLLSMMLICICTLCMLVVIIGDRDWNNMLLNRSIYFVYAKRINFQQIS